MSILAKSEILVAMEAGDIKITPCDPDNIGPASVDLHLSRAFRVFTSPRKAVAVKGEPDFRAFTRGIWLENDDFLNLMPGETILGITAEKIELSGNICGWLEGRSRYARLGLLIHISASYMQPGISNHQVLEMSNFGPLPLQIYPGEPVCQFVFQRIIGEGRYTGRFHDQTPENFVVD